MTDFGPDRRTVLVSSGAALTIGADCNGGDGDDGRDGVSSREDHLADATLSEGDVLDHTDQDEVQVDDGVGAPPAFDPPANGVDGCTTVSWDRVSSNHAVAHTTEDDFDSGFEDGGFEFERTFDVTGEYLSHRQPHRGLGQLGAVAVE